MNKLFSNLIILFTVFLLFTIGCTDKKITDIPTDDEVLAKVNSCEGCHTNYTHLKENYTPDPPSTGGHGCGGDAPHYEPYDRVYMGGEGYDDFKNDIHGKLGCVTCHNGIDGTSDRTLAHSGDFTKEPSHIANEKCASCHPSIVARTTNSIHEQGWGQKMMVIKRGGYGDKPEDFAKCPEELKEGYQNNCFTCHGTCGECHIIRPKIMGGGLSKGHSFIKTPDMREVCAGCHVSRGWDAYAGISTGIRDVHYQKAGFTCMNCHSMDEVHGNGEIQETRFKVPDLPKCENCHTNLNDPTNIYHTTHINDFNCQTCHSQDYNNCGSCHIGTDDGARIPSHLKFKIAMNPIPTIKTQYKMSTVRESLSAPDSWDHYGVPTLANFDVAPTYKYTTPHNILRWTARTDTTVVDSGNAAVSHPKCAQACHVIKLNDGTYRNREFYLFNENPEDPHGGLEDWEKNANKDIVVDGKLPVWWNAK